VELMMGDKLDAGMAQGVKSTVLARLAAADTFRPKLSRRS
jgi:hypothetical protein